MKPEHCIEVPTNENLAMNPAESVEVICRKYTLEVNTLEDTFEINSIYIIL